MIESNQRETAKSILLLNIPVPPRLLRVQADQHEVLQMIELNQVLELDELILLLSILLRLSLHQVQADLQEVLQIMTEATQTQREVGLVLTLNTARRDLR